jgi:hypothetical protein
MGVTQTKGTALIDTDEGRRRDRLPVNRERGLLARPYHRSLKLRARSPSDYRTPGSVTKIVNDVERGHSGSERATEDAGRGELSPRGFRLQLAPAIPETPRLCLGTELHIGSVGDAPMSKQKIEPPVERSSR